MTDETDDFIVLTDDSGQPAAVVARGCMNCKFFAHGLTRFMPNQNGCGQGQSKADWEQYYGHGGCPTFELGVSTAAETTPYWAEYLPPEIVEIDPLEKAYNPNQPRLPAGQPGGGRFVSIGANYNHPQWGKVTADRVDASGQIEVSYRNQQGIKRVRMVSASDLAPMGSVPTPVTVSTPPSARPNSISAALGSEAVKIQAVIDQRKPALLAVESKLKALFPNQTVVARTKSLTSALRDAKFKSLKNPTQPTDPAALDDLVGTRVVFNDNADLLAGAHKFRQAEKANIKWDRAFGLNDPDLYGGNRPANEGYHAIHFNTHDNVEVQMMTERAKYFTEATHNVFDKWELRDGAPGKIKPEYKQYMEAMGAHYNRLDAGQPSTPPVPPPLAISQKLVLANDPLDLSKELDDMTIKPQPTEMKDSLFTNRLGKLAPATDAPVFKDEELTALAAGEEVVVSPDDNHRLHIQRHLNDKGRLLGKSLRGNAEATKLMTNLEKHIQAHRDAQAKNVLG